jgi:hypothetical protein
MTLSLLRYEAALLIRFSYSLSTFFLDKKVEQKSQGRRNRSAHAAGLAHNNQSLQVNTIRCVLDSSF